MSTFDEAVLALCHDVLGGPAVESHTLACVQRELAAQLRRRYPTLGDTIDDLVDEAICRLVERAAGGAIRLDNNPGGYLRVVADRLALQWLRRPDVRLRAATAFVPDTGHDREDDAIAQLIGRLSDAADAHRALDAAIDARDFHATKVLQTYIDHAWRSQDRPLLREVAIDAGISHPTVRVVLRYTASFLREGHERWQRTGSPPGRAW